MAKILPQQRLLLELLTMSGDVAVPTDGDSILVRTLKECRTSGYLTLRELAPGYCRATVTEVGRKLVKPKE